MGRINEEIPRRLRGDQILKSLEKINPEFSKPERILPIGTVMPFFVGGIGWFFSSEAVPSTLFLKDPLSIFCAIVMLSSCLLALVSKIKEWGWDAQYFGIGALYIGSVSLLGIVPFLCIVLYSYLPPLIRLVLFLSYVSAISWWCWRFVLLYRMIMTDARWNGKIYFEDEDAVYYLQKNDTWLLKNRYKFRQLPLTSFFLMMTIIGFSLFPFGKVISTLFGLPVIYFFMAVSFFPLVLMVLGLMTRGYLVYYFYPRKIRKATSKDVYVDMVTRTLH